MTEVSKARDGNITPSVTETAEAEGVAPDRLRQLVAEGEAVVLGAVRGNCAPVCIGKGLRTKVNANIGTSPDHAEVGTEMDKLRAALDAGADAVMDLSTGGDIDAVRKVNLENCSVPLGTVPIYQAVVEVNRAGGEVADCTVDEFFGVIEKQAEEGVDFMTVHCGLTKRLAEKVAATRLAGVVSRGGCFLLQWMVKNKKENPYYEYYDRLLDIAEKFDVALSLGDGLRPGAVADSTDIAQIGELLVIGELVSRARERGVSVFVEGPGHVPLHEIAANMILQKRICHDAPFYVLGPLVTDIAPGYDHITSAIGGAVAAWHGADFLCYVTPSEHLRLPTVEDVHDGVIAARIAAHAGDIAKGLPGASDWDAEISRARAELDWKKAISSSIDPARADSMYDKSGDDSGDVLCSMCGEYCAIRGTKRSREGGGEGKV